MKYIKKNICKKEKVVRFNLVEKKNHFHQHNMHLLLDKVIF
jgi:hypothetical protein